MIKRITVFTFYITQSNVKGRGKTKKQEKQALIT